MFLIQLEYLDYFPQLLNDLKLLPLIYPKYIPYLNFRFNFIPSDVTAAETLDLHDMLTMEWAFNAVTNYGMYWLFECPNPNYPKLFQPFHWFWIEIQYKIIFLFMLKKSISGRKPLNINVRKWAVRSTVVKKYHAAGDCSIKLRTKQLVGIHLTR